MKPPVQSLGVVLLAAGSSSRMGRPKLLLPWGETSVLGHQLAVWQASGADHIAVVCAAGDTAMQAELDRLNLPGPNRIKNPQPERGMFSSIRCAAAWPGWRAGLTHWVITLGDQPQVRPDTLLALARFAADQPDKICQPKFLGRARHPVVLPKKFFLALRDTGAETLKAYLQFLPADQAACEVDDPGLDCDLDTPADYERALRLYFPGR